MVLNFGFQTLEDGSRECYHAGEYFHGNVPILSQVMLLIFKVHARWVVWSTEHHVNHYAFSAGSTDEEEEMEEQSRANMPLFLLKNYAWSDLMAMLFGYKEGDLSREKQPSFLVIDDSSEHATLPFQKKAVQIRISEDIEADRQAMKSLLSEYCPEDVKKILARRATLVRRRTNAGKKKDEDVSEDGEEVDEEPTATVDVYAMATDLAADRALQRRLTRQQTKRGS
jgi:hypothetical protein